MAGGDGVDVRFAGVLRFADDVVGTFDCGFDVPQRSAIEVEGEGGALVSWDPWHGTAPARRSPDPDGPPQAVPGEAVNPYRLELENPRRRSGRRRAALGRADAVAQARVHGGGGA